MFSSMKFHQSYRVPIHLKMLCVLPHWMMQACLIFSSWEPGYVLLVPHNFSYAESKRYYGACKAVRLLWCHSELLPERKTLPTETRSRYRGIETVWWSESTRLSMCHDNDTNTT
jgi:hypothetical protein